MSIEQFETEVLELARVRTPEGSEFYGLPIGALITRDEIEAKDSAAAAKGLKPPKNALSSGKSGAGSHMAGTISGKAAGRKNQPKPPTPQKLKIKIKKSSLTGNKHFSVGKSKYTAPNGSKLIRPASQPGMAYVVTSEGEVHAFNEAGEIEIPKTLKAVFENKFSDSFEGDDNYSVEEFEVTSAPFGLSELQPGAILNDQRGTPQFKKVGDDAWEHIDLGVKLKDNDLQALYDDGELVPDPGAPETKVAEEAFADVEATNFTDMDSTEFNEALDAMPEGQEMSYGSNGGILTKQANGNWESSISGNEVSASNLYFAKSTLKIGKPAEPEYNPLDVNTANPLSDEKPLIGVGDTPDEDWINKALPGAQLTFNNPNGSKTIWTLQENGSWKNQKGGTMSSGGMKTNFSVGGENLKITKEGKGTTATAPERREQPGEQPVGTKGPTRLRSTSTLKPGEGDYTELASLEQMEVSTIGDRILVEFAGGEMVSEYELTEDGKWTNVDDPEDFFGPVTVKAMVGDPGNEQVYIHATKQSKPLSPEPESEYSTADLGSIEAEDDILSALNSAEIGDQIHVDTADGEKHSYSKSSDKEWTDDQTGVVYNDLEISPWGVDLKDGPLPTPDQGTGSGVSPANVKEPKSDLDQWSNDETDSWLELMKTEGAPKGVAGQAWATQKMQGMDKGPEVLPSSDFEAVKGEPLFRGVGTPSQKQSFLKGEHFVGMGGSGSGVYFSTDKSHAGEFGNFEDERIIEAKIKPGAKIVDGAELDAQREVDFKKHKDAGDLLAAQLASGDLNLYASARGIDGYRLTVQGVPSVVIANSNALVARGPVESTSGQETDSGVSKNKEGGQSGGAEDGLDGGNAVSEGPGGVAEEPQPGLGGVDGPGDSGGNGGGVQLAGGYAPPLLNDGKPLELDERTQALKDKGLPVAELYELDAEGGAFDAFYSSISKLKENNPYHASVYVYPEGEYGNMRLFLNSDGTAGVALKGDEIVSVFVQPNSKDKGSSQSLISQAVAQGGKRLDAYDTVLPKIYAKEGFVAVARTPWNDEYAPEGWDKETYSKFNGGEPDVVFMKYDPEALDGDYDPNDGVVVSSYDEGVALAKGEGQAGSEHPLIEDSANAKKIGGQAGSNAGGLYELTMPDGSKQKYYVKKAQSEDHGNNESLANALYRELGVAVPEFDHAEDGNLYSKVIDGPQDMDQHLDDQEWLDKVRRDFAIDAWLSNRDVFGLTNDNIITATDGTPTRIDNGGALRYRAMGAKKKDFGPEVTELEAFRTGKKAKVFGSGMTKEQELDGAKRIQAMTPEKIQALVSEHGMDQEMADTLIARRQYILDQYGLSDEVTQSQNLPEGVPEGSIQVPGSSLESVPDGATVYTLVTGTGPGGSDQIIVHKKTGTNSWQGTLPSGLVVDNVETSALTGLDGHYLAPSPEDLAEPEVVPDWEMALMEPPTSGNANSWQWDVGHTITSVADLDSIPPGTKLAYTKKDGSKTFYTKLDNGAFLTPGGSVYASSQLSGSAKSGKFQVESIPETNAPAASAGDSNPQGYIDGDAIAKMSHVNGFAEGQKLSVIYKGKVANTVLKTDKGWVAQDDGFFDKDETITAGEMGTLVTNSALKYKAQESAEIPASTEYGYTDGDSITKMGHVNGFAEGQKLTVVHPTDGQTTANIEKIDGVWEVTDSSAGYFAKGYEFSASEMGQLVVSGSLKYVSPQPQEDQSTTLDTQLWSGAPAMSQAQLADAMKALQAHSSFHVKYGLLSLPDNHPLKDEANQEELKTAALNKFPDLKPKPAVVQYLKDAIGIQEGGEVTEDDTTMVHLGSKDPKSTGVQGADGGDFSVADIKKAVEILEAYDGKLFKAELNKKGNALGSLNPNSLVGFDKDKTVVKQKFVDLLKAKLVRTEESIKHPKVTSMEEFEGLQVGTQVSFNSPVGEKFYYTKVSETQWVSEASGSMLPNMVFKPNIKTGTVRIEKQPDPLPDYAKTPAAIQDKHQEEIDSSAEDFSLQSVKNAEVGTKIQNNQTNDLEPTMYAYKVAEDQWDFIWAQDGSKVDEISGSPNNDQKIFDYLSGKDSDWGFSPQEGPNFNQNSESGIVPGKYSTKTGKAYMVVSADGTGVYVNTKGGVSKLTKAAVKKNFDAGMDDYQGIPESVPTATPKAATAKPKVVADIADGTYFAGSPNNAKTAVYEISGDKAKVFKPNSSVGSSTGTKIGGHVNEPWLAEAGLGARFTNDGMYVDGNYAGKVTWTKGENGIWHATSSKPDVVIEPTDKPAFDWYHSNVSSHGLSDPVDLPKAKVNTLFSQGKLVDQNGMSVVPEGYSGAVYFFGSPTTIPSLVSARKYLEDLDVDNAGSLSSALKNLGVYWDIDLWRKYKAENGFAGPGPQNAVGAMKKAMDDQLAGVDTEIPDSGAADLFEWNDMGQAKIPVDVAAMTYNTYDKNSMGYYIKAASKAIGDGNIIGQHLVKMDKWDRQKWIVAFKKGDFKAMYDLEVAAAAKEGKAHNAGYLHPGYQGNEATNQIIWAPAVEGEISALDEVEGDWTSPGITPSMAEVDNYLIKAQMQNPTHLSAQEKRQWYQQHKNKNKDVVDQLSALAASRKKNGDQALSDSPVWTDDVQPAKAYDTVFENAPTPFPTGDMWHATPYNVTTEWAKDHLEDPEFKAFYTADDPNWNPNDGNYQTQYKTEQLVADYFDKKHNEYQEELLKPVYSLTKKVGLGSHEVWFAKDQFDRQYIFKPADSKDYQIRLQMEGKANDLARFWGFNAAKATMGEIDGKTGLIQDFVPSISSFAGEDGEGIQMSTLSEKQLSSVAAEHVLDWMLDNDDTHPDNLLIKQDGSIVGIDKGRSFYVYGNWDGITGDASAHTNAPDASNSEDFLVYTRLYNDIREGKITQEQATAAYFGARKAALRIQNSSDAAVEQMVRDAVQGRQNWDVPDYMTHFTNRKAPADADALVKAVLYRKNHLSEQIDAMWTKIFADSGLGGLPEAPPKVFENHISGWEEPDVIDQASDAKVWGAAPLHASASIVNGHSLIWTEQDENGNELHKGKFAVGELAQNKILAFLQPKAQQVQINGQSQNIYLNSAEFPTTTDFKSAITAAGKNVTKNSVDKEYDADIISTFKEMETTLQTDAQHWSPDLQPEGGNDYVTFPSGKNVPPEYLPQYKLMLDHYLGMADKVNTAIAEGGTTDKSQFSVFQALAPKKDPRVLTAPDGAKYTELANGQWLKSDGSLVAVGALPVDANDLPEGWTSNVEPTPVIEQVLYTTQTAAGNSGVLGENGVKTENSKDEGTAGHTGKEYRMILPTGEVITFRNGSTTSTVRSQHGQMSFKLAGADKQASLVRVQAQIELMGLDMSGAEQEQAELNYWRAMFGRVLFSDAESSGSAGVKSALKKLKDKKSSVKGPNGENLSDNTLIEGIGLSMGDEEELQWWRDLANEAFGKDKTEAWIASEKYLPKFQHMDLMDTEKNTGMPYYERIDVDVEELQKKGHMVAIGNSSKDEGLLKYITSGGMLSTEERLRVLGYWKTGASSTSDQGTGGANSVFTRIAKGSALESGSLYGKHVAYWNPAVMAQVGTYSYGSDQFGDLGHLQNSNKYDPLKSLESYSGHSNETMVSNAISIFDFLELMVFDNAAKRNEAIQRMKALGFETLRGLPIEDRLIMRVNLKQAREKVKAQWKK